MSMKQLKKTLKEKALPMNETSKVPELPTDKTSSVPELPIPTGYHILVQLPTAEKVTKGGIHMPDDLVARETTASMLALVVAMGPQCYKGKTASGHPRFPEGPWCKIGDCIIMKSYAGSRIKAYGNEYRIITDDTVQAVATNPNSIGRG